MWYTRDIVTTVCFGVSIRKRWHVYLQTFASLSSYFHPLCAFLCKRSKQPASLSYVCPFPVVSLCLSSFFDVVYNWLFYQPRFFSRQISKILFLLLCQIDFYWKMCSIPSLFVMSSCCNVFVQPVIWYFIRSIGHYHSPITYFNRCLF